MKSPGALVSVLVLSAFYLPAAAPALAEEKTPQNGFHITESEAMIRVSGEALDFSVRKTGYVSGVAEGSFVDKKSGFHDPGYGLDIVDFLLEPGSDESDRDRLPEDLRYDFGNNFHGKRAKRIVEGPQICTHAKALTPSIVNGPDFVAIRQSWTYTEAAPGIHPGSTWEQTLVFPRGCRYFIAADRMTVANDSPALAFRIDLPGHIRHHGGDTFSEVYLSYFGRIPAREFATDFAPDEKFNYRRDSGPVPERMIRAYHLRDPKTGANGPWLAGLTLDPAAVSEAWCHERGYVCFIEEIGERPMKAGDSFGAAYIIGYFDSIDEMNAVYDQYKGHTRLSVSPEKWELTAMSHR